MASHRRLLWLIAVLAGLAAAVLYMSGTAGAEIGSTAASGGDTNSSASAPSSASTSTRSDTGESTKQSADATTVSTTNSATRTSSLDSAITQAKDARSSATQAQSARETSDTSETSVAVRSPVVRAFAIDTTPSAAQKKSEPLESVTAAAPEKPEPQRQLAAAVVDVMSELGSSPQPEPPAAASRQAVAEPVVTTVTVNDERLAEAAGREALVATNSPPAEPTAAVSAPSDPTTFFTPQPATTPTVIDGVTVGHATLEIPCGPGYDVPADWYFPTGPDPPDGVIWLQHGFLAQGPWYSTTAATLAKKTNSIVVAPSLTSNFLQCDGCWLNGDPMERAVATMLNDSTALTASASAAAGQPITLPDKLVLVGHSAGGGFAVAVAGYLAGTSAFENLGGVVMFDGVALNTSISASLEKIRDLPVYQISAPSYIWDNFGSGTAQLIDARPGKFVGFELAGGSHVDSMRGNTIIDFAAQLLTGFSPRGNFEAVETLATGWIKDMYDPGGHAGIYAEAGQTIKIGKATATALPTPPTWFTPIERLIRHVALVFEEFFFGFTSHHAAPAVHA